MHHEHRDAGGCVADAGQRRRSRQPAGLHRVGAGHASPDARESQGLAGEGPVGPAHGRQRVENRAGQSREPEQDEHPASGRGRDQAQDARRHSGPRRQPGQLAGGEQAGCDDLAASADGARSRVPVGARSPVHDLVHTVGDESLEQQPDRHGQEVGPDHDIAAAVRGDGGAEGDGRVGPVEERNHPHLQVDAEEAAAIAGERHRCSLGARGSPRSPERPRMGDQRALGHARLPSPSPL